MAQGIRFVCSHCSRGIVAWSDGNPYFINAKGEKEYAYHPDHERLERCIGNDSPHLCLGCGEGFMVDSEAPISVCPKCGTSEIADTYRLAGCGCPFCKVGTFAQDPNFFAIS